MNGSSRKGARSVTPAEVYVAGLQAGAATFRLWTRAAVEYAADVRRTINPGSRRRKGYVELSADLLDDYQAYLRRLTMLPQLYGLQFLSELQRLHDRKRRTAL